MKKMLFDKFTMGIEATGAVDLRDTTRAWALSSSGAKRGERPDLISVLDAPSSNFRYQLTVIGQFAQAIVGQ